MAWAMQAIPRRPCGAWRGASWKMNCGRGGGWGLRWGELGQFDSPNNNARAGRRAAISNKLTSAANKVAVGDEQGAIDELTSLLQKVDGDPSPADWMADGPQKDSLRYEIELMISLLQM